LKELEIGSKRSLINLSGALTNRLYWRKRRAAKWWNNDGEIKYEINLLLQAGKINTLEVNTLKTIFSIYNTIRGKELQEIEAVTQKIEQIRKSLLKEGFFDSPGNMNLIFRDIPFLLRFAETGSWWTKLEKSTANKVLNVVEKQFKKTMSQILRIKMPITLFNTNVIKVSSENDEGMLLRYLVYSNFVKLIIIIIGYLFLHSNIFSQPPLYFSPLMSILFSCIFGSIFVQLSLYPSEQPYIYLQFYYYLGYIPVILHIAPILLILFHNTIPFPKTSSFQLWEKFVILLNPLLLVTVFFTIIWYHKQPDIGTIYIDIWGVLYAILSVHP
jgi:hypothetical protein